MSGAVKRSSRQSQRRVEARSVNAAKVLASPLFGPSFADAADVAAECGMTLQPRARLWRTERGVTIKLVWAHPYGWTQEATSRWVAPPDALVPL